MLTFLHIYNPSPIIFQIGRVVFHWYGLFIILGIIAGLFVIFKLAKKYQLEKEKLYNLFFELIIFGIIGARLFTSLYNWQYFSKHPLDIFKIWQGGMSIHGAIIAGIIVLLFYCRRYKLSFWFWADLVAPGLVLGQAIGRWGNYFNQELYGRPLSGIFAIPISLANRVVGFEGFNYFHPTFLYEFILNLIIFGILIWLHRRNLESEKHKEGLALRSPERQRGAKEGSIFLTYLFFYSVLRFLIEFLRIDPQPTILNLRFGQWISLLIIIISLFIILNRSLCFLWRKGH